MVTDLLRKAAKDAPDRVAMLVDGHGQMTYAEWHERSSRVAHGLLALGIDPGDRVALRFDNADGLLYATSYQAIHKAGGVAVPINTKFIPAEVEHVVGHSEAKFVLDNDSIAPLLAHPDTSDVQVERAGGDLADILYTSGTTGFPKGVCCTHDNVNFKGSSSLSAMFSGARFLHAVPLFTFAGTHAMSLMCLRGAMTHILQARFEPRRYLELLAEHRVNLSYAVPAMVMRMLDEPRMAQGGFESLRILMYGTAPMPPHGIRGLATHFSGTFLINLYGLTEGGAAVLSLSPTEALKRPESIGKPLPPTEVRIQKEDGSEASALEHGEIMLRTPVTPRWYHKDEAASAETWSADGWLKTGDIGYMDDDGYMHLVDRIKDLIIAGGHNISAPEVEGVLHEHPDVVEAAIVGAPHAVMGEVPHGFVVVRGTPDGPALSAFLRLKLAEYKVPRTWSFVEQLPRNAIGKVLKRELRSSL